MQGIISEPREILDELAASREHGSAIGIWASPLGGGLHMCEVENIYDDDVEHDQVIVLKEKDLKGERLEVRVLFLQEIDRLFSLKTRDHTPI